MIILHILFSVALFLFIQLPLMLVSVPVVALNLIDGWDGRDTIFGNDKWGKGELNPAYMKSGYWAAFVWLVWRNPVNNLLSFTLAAPMQPYHLKYGNPNIGDKIHGGWYFVRMGFFWEYYIIFPYMFLGKKYCIRIRIGWKILANPSNRAPFVLVFNPCKKYLGD